MSATETHAADVETWREERYARLRAPMSWLTLVGLEWLHEGDNRMGSGPQADVRLPSGPAVAGRLVRRGSQVTAHATPQARLAFCGGAVEALPLVNDADAPEGEGPTLLELGPLRMCVIRRGQRIGLRVWDTELPVRQAFTDIPHYPVDVAWRLKARFEPPAPGETIEVADVIGEVEAQPMVGSVAFDIAGATHRLRAVDGGDGRLWLIFGDETNGDTTCGGGRYLYTDPPADDGTVVVDFNRAYNPPCVFSAFATCPLPPPENRLRVRIEAGERLLG